MTDSDFDLAAARDRARRLEDIIGQIQERYAEYPAYADELSAAYIERLLETREEIDGVLRIVSLSPSDAVLHIRTRLRTSESPRASLLVDSISGFRSALLRVTAAIHGVPREGPGRIPEDLRLATDFKITGLARGSLKIGVNFVPNVSQSSLPGFDQETSIERDFWRALQLIWDTARVVSSEDSNRALADLLPTADIREIVLREIARLSPPKGGQVTSLTLEGNPGLTLGNVELTTRTRASARKAMYPGSPVEDFDDTGVLRAIEVDRDTKKHRLVLRQRPDQRPDINGDFDEALRLLVMDAVHNAHRVRVTGVLETRSKAGNRPVLHIEGIEILYEPNSSSR